MRTSCTQPKPTKAQQRRLEAVSLIEQGWSVSAVARHVGRTRTTIHHWLERYEAQGAEGLKPRPPGPQARLTSEQLDRLAEDLLEGPEAHGYPTQLWTLARIRDLIAQQTGVSYHPGHVWHLLRRLNWTCQKPEGAAKERNEEAIA